ncbi:PTS glucose transporter subunit IIA [Neobacillus sp. PS3-40]|uniref:PTS sugar transporter subunit IIA n=1 Tax=Neobacillus sp. PS3-40 TaxID=3070679 RepID=UPI0027E10E8E|nr:PTS glucose transporter subunit IIA [Neobacillus sp. PS3-40]WML45755.1 PTS glucose transporter subunit IIA [Neobacillus sp. PS3-40]
MAFKFFKKQKLQIFAPINGEIIPIEQVQDPVFSEKMMGEGIAVIPSEGNICSPVEGTIIQVAPTKHAIGILTEDGTEILVHIGLETVALKGEGFTVAVNMGEKVSVGQLLVEVDWEFIKNHAKSIVTPIVITNSNEGKKRYTPTEEKEGKVGKTVIITGSEK